MHFSEKENERELQVLKKKLNDAIENDLKAHGIAYEIISKHVSDEYTKLLEGRYGLSETAKLELFSESRVVLHYHKDTHAVLNEVFRDCTIYVRCKETSCDRLFKLDGQFSWSAMNYFPGGNFVLFLEDLSFILVDHFSQNIIYDGVRNEFYHRADKLLRDFYK